MLFKVNSYYFLIPIMLSLYSSIIRFIRFEYER